MPAPTAAFAKRYSRIDLTNVDWYEKRTIAYPWICSDSLNFRGTGRCRRTSRIIAAVMALCSISGCTPAATSPEALAARSICSAVPARSVVVFGELHGTEEAPRLFRELVHCRMKRAEGALLVGLELPPEALAAVLALPPHEKTVEALQELSRNEFWRKSRDGRTSIANFELINYLRAAHNDGRLSVFAFDLRKSAKDNFSQTAAEAIEKALFQAGAESFAGDVLILTGNGHATMAPDSGSLGRGLASKGMRPYIFQTTFGSGEAWVCRMGKCGVSVAGSGRCENNTTTDFKTSDLRVHSLCLPLATASPPAISGLVSG